MKKVIVSFAASILCGLTFATDSYTTIRHAQITPTNRVVTSIPTWAQSDTPPSVGGITTNDVGIIATNTVDAKVAPWAMKGQPQPGGGGADTNAVNDLIREYDTTNLTARIAYRTTTNDVNAIIASSNLCTVADAEAMTNGVKAYADATFLKGDGEYQTKSLHLDYITAEVYISTTGHITLQGGWNYLGTLSQTLPEYLNSLDWRTTENRTLANYGITDAYTKSEINGNAVTNGGAKAYADATCVKYSSTYGSMYVMTNEIAFYKYPGNFRSFILSKEGLDFSTLNRECGAATNNTGITFSGVGPSRSGGYRLACDDNGIGFVSAYIHGRTHNYTTSYLVPDGSPVATSNMVERVIASKPAPSPLTGKTYDFANGVNFTKNLYTALTNVIQTLDGTVTNPPNFD